MDEDLVGQLIADINEITEVPFFDVKLPKEVGIKVFSFLDYRDLCHCSQVSWSWHALADDEVLWCRICQKHGLEKEPSLGVGWKGLARRHFIIARILRQNWQERHCRTQELQNPRCRVLCHASSNGSQVIAGYDTGDVCLWNVKEALDRAIVLSQGNITPEGSNRVTCTSVTDFTSAASFLNGNICVWNSVTGERQLLYNVLGCIKCIALSPEGNCLAIAHSNGVQTTFQSHQLCHVYQSCSDTEEWLWLCKDTFDIPLHEFSQPLNINNISFVQITSDSHQVVITSDRDVRLHTIGCYPDKMLIFEGGEARQIRLTCSDNTTHLLACGVSGYGYDALSEGYKVRLHSLQTGQFLYSLSGHGNDVLCVDIDRAPENMLVSGSADKSVRVFDLRMSSSAFVLRGHISYVSHVQMDDWKVVSGT
jgi:F-box/WD-40 domain protein 8